MPDHKEFWLEWSCEGPKTPQVDKDGENVWQLWRIWNKCTRDDGEICYEVQYWEADGANLIWPVSVSEVKDAYPKQVDLWEKTYAKKWKTRYGDGGNVWQAEALESKRVFDDTPGKVKQAEMKKTKLTVAEMMRQDEDDEDPFIGASSTTGSRFGMGPPPKLSNPTQGVSDDSPCARRKDKHGPVRTGDDSSAGPKSPTAPEKLDPGSPNRGSPGLLRYLPRPSLDKASMAINARCIDHVQSRF